MKQNDKTTYYNDELANFASSIDKTIEDYIISKMIEVADKLPTDVGSFTMQYHESIKRIKYANNNSITKHIFLKIKEYIVLKLITELTFFNDIQNNDYMRMINFTAIIALFSTTHDEEQYKEIYSYLKNTTASFDTILARNCCSRTNKSIRKSAQNLLQITSDTTDFNKVITLYSNNKEINVFSLINKTINCKLKNTYFFKNIPFLFSVEEPNFIKKLPKHFGYHIILSAHILNPSSDLNFYKKSNTSLNHLNTHTEIDNYNNIIANYNDSVQLFNALLYFLNQENLLLERNIIYFYSNEFLSNKFIHSLSSPYIDYFYNNIDIPFVYRYSKMSNKKRNKLFSNSFYNNLYKLSDNITYLHFLELLMHFNICIDNSLINDLYIPTKEYIYHPSKDSNPDESVILLTSDNYEDFLNDLEKSINIDDYLTFIRKPTLEDKKLVDDLSLKFIVLFLDKIVHELDSFYSELKKTINSTIDDKRKIDFILLLNAIISNNLTAEINLTKISSDKSALLEKNVYVLLYLFKSMIINY